MAGGQAGGAGLHKEHRHALHAGGLVGHGGDAVEGGDAAVGDEALAAVEDVAVAVLHGGGLAGAGVGAGARLGEAEGAEATVHDQLAGPLLQLLAAGDQHRLGAQAAGGDGGGKAGVGLGHLLKQGGHVHPAQAHAAVLLGHLQHVQLHLDGLVVNLLGPLAGAVVLLALLLDFLLTELLDSAQQLLSLFRNQICHNGFLLLCKSSFYYSL